LGAASTALDNVIRGSNWVVQTATGEVKNNVILEADTANGLRTSTGPFHHNIVAHSYPGVGRYGDPSTGRRWYGGISLGFSGTQNSQIYNNSIDPRGTIVGVQDI